MSFKLKTILLALGVGIIPYLAMIFVFVVELKEDMVSQAKTELEMRSKSIVEQIDYELNLIKNDLNSTSNMDVMADIMSMDLDKRIADAIQKKKNTFTLIGNYYVTNEENILIATTDQNISAQSKFEPAFMVSLPIYAQFKPTPIGTLYLDYKPENFNKFLTSTASEKFSVIPSERNAPKGLFTVTKKINNMNKYTLLGVLEEGALLQSYNKAENEMLVFLLCGALLISIISYIFASKMVQPVLVISEEADMIAQSKEYSKRLNIISKDELSVVAKAFNNLLSSIEDALAKLQLESQNKLKLIEEQSKNETLSLIAKKLSKYLSPQIVESIITGEHEDTIVSRRKKLTIFFSDIVNFTSTTDTMEAEDLSELLNSYLNIMSQIALSHGATIDKFIGDAIMVFFGDPKSNGDKEDALACVKMAIEMRQKLDDLAEFWQSKGFVKPFKVRMGIHTGYCTVGNFGNEERMDYTIIGGAVNLTSRLESAAKPNQIIISEETYLLVSDLVACDFVDTITVKGIAQPIRFYEAQKLKSASETIKLEQEGIHIKINLDKIQNKESLKQSLIKLAEQIS